MPLKGSAQARSAEIIDRIAEELGCEPAVIDAIITVETRGAGFEDGLLIIRPETHKIKSCPYLTDAEKAKAQKTHGKQPNTANQDYLWDWLDGFRLAYGDEAAYWITSFGAPQMMGFNCHLCGYDMPSTMVEAFAESEDNQFLAMAKFLKANGMVPALRTRQWKQIARLYNGKNYAQNAYDVKLRQAYEKSKFKKGSALHVDDDILQFGDQGPRVKALQQQLRKLGFYVDDDGDFGAETRDAVKAFQSRNALTVDGRVGPETQRRLDVAPPKEPNAKPITQIAKESKTVQAGAATAGLGGVGLVASLGSVATSAIPAAPVPGPGVSLDTLNTVVVQADRGVGVAQKVFAMGTDKVLLALALCAVILGGIAVWQRIAAQRARKIG